MKRFVPLLMLLSVIITGCVSSKGDLFTAVTAPVSEGKVDQAESESTLDESVSEADDYEPGIEIETYPAGASVYFDRDYAGLSDLFIDNPSTGEYLVRITMPGYYPVEEWIHFEQDTYLCLSYTLEEIRGYLDIRVRPTDAQVLIDGVKADSRLLFLSVGRHDVDLRLFGFRTWKGSVTIEEDRTTTLDVVLEEAPFALHGASASKRAFNPDNPGLFGQAAVSFIADNRGSAVIEITDKVQAIVRTLYAGPFTEWDQSFRWDGRDESGRIVPDGTYRILIRGIGDDGESAETSCTVEVDRSLVIRPRALSSGIPGLLYCPVPDILPADTMQISTLVVGHFENGVAFFPVQAGFRLSLPGNLEAAVQGTILTVAPEDDGYSLGLALKYPLTQEESGIFHAAGCIRATYQGVRSTDTLTDFTGLSASFPLSLGFGPVRLYLAPEAVISFSAVDYGDAEVIVALNNADYNDEANSNFHAWAYGRAGLAVEIPGFSAGISAVLRTTSFTRGLGIYLPMEIGGEVNVIIPGTQFFASAYGICEISFMSEYYILLGGGLHFIF